MKKVFKSFFKFLMSYNLVEAWLKKMQPRTVTDITERIAYLLDGLEGADGFKIRNKFKTKVVNPAFTDGYTYVKLRNLYNYVLQHSSFKDNPEYAIMPLPESIFSFSTLHQSYQNYLNYIMSSLNIFQA